MTLRKPNGSLCPIATGESIRLTNKVKVGVISDRARTTLEPLHVGVKTANGCEATDHVTRQWFHDHHRADRFRVALSLDISNAFNSVHRTAVLHSVRTHFPPLRPRVDCCYRHDSTLFAGADNVASQVITSARSVPVLFALAIHPVIQEARRITDFSHPCGIDFSSLSWPGRAMLLVLLDSWVQTDRSRVQSGQDRSHPPRARLRSPLAPGISQRVVGTAPPV